MLETLLEKDFNSFVDSTHVASSSQLAADFKPSQDFVVPQLVPDGYEFPVFVDSTHVASSSQLAADFKPSQDFVLPQSVPDGDEFPVNAQHLINLANDRYWKDPLECSFSFPSHEVENGACDGSGFNIRLYNVNPKQCVVRLAFRIMSFLPVGISIGFEILTNSYRKPLSECRYC